MGIEQDERYKIGDVARLLGIPVQTLRYYEDKGLVRPIKDDKTGYRYYTAWEIDRLLDSLQLRNLDFSINETESILKSNSLEEIIGKYTDQEKNLIRQIQRQKRLLFILSRQKQKLQTFQQLEGQFIIRNSPDLLFHRHRIQGTFQSSDGNTSLDALIPEMESWLALMPDVMPTFLLPLSQLKPDTREMGHWWGLSTALFGSFEKEAYLDGPNEYLPARKSMYTVFSVSEKGKFPEVFFDEIYTKLMELGYSANGSPVGRQIIKTETEDSMMRYYEVWIPLE